MPLSDLPQSNRQHAVPQNIMSVEFKLIGDLTMRQFAYLLVFGLVAYICAMTVVGIFKWPLVVFFIVAGVGFAFVPFAERGMDEWIVNFIKAVYAPTLKIWKKEPTVPTAFLYDNLSVVQQELITLAPTSSRRKLEEFLKYQDKNIKTDPLDIPEQEYAMKVKQAFNYSGAPSYTAPMQPVGGNIVGDVGVSVIEEPSPEMLQEQNVPEQPQTDEQKQAGDQPHEQESSAVVTNKKPIDIRSQKPKPVYRPQPELEIKFPRENPNAEVALAPMTPDMHSGRRFTNLVPSKGELVLPIRGERVLQTSDDIKLEKELKEKAEQLQKLLSDIKEKESIKDYSPKVETQRIKEQAKEEVSSIDKKIEALKQELADQQKGNVNSATTEQRLKELMDQKEKMASSYTELEKRLEDLKKQLEDKEKSALMDSLNNQKGLNKKLPPLTDKPNIISGFVFGSDEKALENILLLIKNSRNEPVRALKTNTLGQFILSTPLENGVYTIEVSPNNEISLTFDIIPVEVKGEVISPVEMIGK